MTEYRNFTVDFPARLRELDHLFQPSAKDADYEVSYLLMKLAASFLLPYERIEGTSGARKSDVANPQAIRKYLELDKRFQESTYFSETGGWTFFDVDDFDSGPSRWACNDLPTNRPVHEVLEVIRHSLAHSNLFFGGEDTIAHIYLGSRRVRDPDTNKYCVLRSSISGMNTLVDAWIENLMGLRASPALIWKELERAA